MRAALLFLSLAAWAAALPFIGEPSIFEVKVTTHNCTKRPGQINGTVLEDYTSIESCHAAEQIEEEYFVTCNATHLVSTVSERNMDVEPCHGNHLRTIVLPLNKCVLQSLTGRETGHGYTYDCFEMWCNSSCRKPPCPLDVICPLNTMCCLNDDRYETPCGSLDICLGEPLEEAWYWGLLRKALLLGIVVSAVIYAWKMGWCNICPWRRPYATLYGEMA